MRKEQETTVLHPSPGLPGEKPPFLLILFLCLSLFFIGLGAYPLYDPDEGRNAEVAREIITEGHWLPPTLNGEVRYQKPPLYYWLVAVSFKTWGLREFAARLPSALAALLGALVTAILGIKLWGKERAWWAGIILATSPIYAIYAHIVIFDMVLTLFITLAITLAWWGINQNNKNLLRLSALSASLAFLTKGPIGVLIPIMALLPPMIYRVRKGEKPTLPWISMILIFFMVSAPAFIVAELRSLGYCYKFFWEENVLRYLTPRFHRPGPWFYYLVVILVGLFPWTWFLKEIPKGIERLRETNFDELLLLGSWILLPTLFFTFSQSKLPHYILPTFPAWALLLAYFIPLDTSRKVLTALTGVIPVIYISGFLLIAPLVTQYRSTYPLIEKAQLRPEIPIVAYKTVRYSLAFYTGRKIKVIEKKSLLAQVLEEKGPLYIFTKKTRLPPLLSLAQREKREVKVFSKSSQYYLLLISPNQGRPATHALRKTPHIQIPTKVTKRKHHQVKS